jgi:hypothetical protein
MALALEVVGALGGDSPLEGVGAHVLEVLLADRDPDRASLAAAVFHFLRHRVDDLLPSR